eukprot:2119034-Pyramimonas_sp.AAC.1
MSTGYVYMNADWVDEIDDDWVACSVARSIVIRSQNAHRVAQGPPGRGLGERCITRSLLVGWKADALITDWLRGR